MNETVVGLDEPSLAEKIVDQVDRQVSIPNKENLFFEVLKTFK
ncbi:hypothetical protein TMUPMC115_0130 [Tetragenococcus muriaticus PMC-11-5]|uniref:Uncharacterized protein n=2 Tax=Tetragenococcus muriaticus TaxID=64642 RepID=A0A091CAK4_9ENTE|nr:hypothetical protein TMUPMC115_0130 [Tetragenococcus muriaticus PMC-11-5]